ncbi:MAG: GNAT family N-acetyltransferase, partial [Oscillospiraceae bacterium]|nr:GNAT family N-acetyltransferase [Oscillospiraceae bacterium]
LQTALEILRDRGCRTLRCYVEPENIPSLNLQRKHGFSEKPFQAFDELINDGDLMFEKELQSFEVVSARVSDAYYICEMYEKSIKELHGGALDEQGCRSFFAEIKEMLTNRDPDEENFLIYFGAFPCCWVKVNGLESGDTGWISMLTVEPKFRRRGAGSFAVNFAVNFLTEKGKKIAKIQTTEDNIPALSLYKSCGFSAAENRRAVSGDGTERVYITLEKNL